MPPEQAVSTELYTAEAGPSRRQAQAEIATPDPSDEEAARIIAEETREDA
jgi:hypothetical protein